jgi:hypothetical protein
MSREERRKSTAASRVENVTELNAGCRAGLSTTRLDYGLALDRNSQVHMMMTADVATINSAQMKVT